MTAIPNTEDELSARIYRAYEQARGREKSLPLSRLGASGIGEECVRRLFFSWRAYTQETFKGATLRIFDTGNREEERVIKDLRAAGLSVWDKDPETEAQFTFTDKTGHLAAKVDGIVRGVPGAEKTAHLLEIKTHSEKSWNHLNEYRLKTAKPLHYAQVQVGMWLAKLKRGLYIAVNKNNDQFYIERVHPDPQLITEVKAKVADLITGFLTPAGISDKANAPGCRFCPYTDVCLGQAKPTRSCRSCGNSQPLAGEGEWVCTLLSQTLTLDEQRKGCENYQSRTGKL